MQRLAGAAAVPFRQQGFAFRWPVGENHAMPTYVAFLRAVNVGKRKYPMAELRAALDAAGYDQVETHIQTGNVLLTTPVRSRARVEKALEELFEQDRGFVVRRSPRTPRRSPPATRRGTATT